jgi:ribosomal protein S18 acetylase RimI-like enzyme
MSQASTNNYTIIEATVAHLDLVAPLFNDYRIFYKQPDDLGTARAYLQARLENEESIIYLAVRETAQGLVGIGFTQLYPLFSSLSLKRIWVLYDLFVAPQARQQGVGEALLTRAKVLAAETDAAEIVLDTAIDNYSAQALYEKVGYKREEAFYTYYLNLK